MTSREKLQYSYELAFYPPRLNEVWYQVKQKRVADLDELGELLDMALQLHGALPSDGYASQRALNRLALYQAKSRAFHAVSFLRNVRKALGRASLPQAEVPGSMVRDIGLPRLSRP
ncbi:MAG: hypothetical protein HN919_12765 [Verrucomicrobia bacterium]|jgi:hypothetical protein|nr:hypothetical protein [Verrucomicrobiota bacterium]